MNGNQDGWLIETAAGLLDSETPAARIRKEVEEETGYKINNITPVFAAFMSPGSTTERPFFIAEYEERDNQSVGGGNVEECEGIEVLEFSFDSAIAMIASGEICDGKTIMLLQHVALNIFNGPRIKMEISGDH